MSLERLALPASISAQMDLLAMTRSAQAPLNRKLKSEDQAGGFELLQFGVELNFGSN
jgi:hypothetical protein